MEVERIVADFARLPGADISESAPLSSAAKPWETATSALAGRYPGLSRYPDYLWFLAKIGGASLMHDPPQSIDYVFLEVYGFGRFGEKIEADEDGFLGFAELQARYKPHDAGQRAFEGCVWRVFALDVSGDRAPLVYAPSLSQDHGCLPRWPTFAAWLAEVVATDGKLPL